MKSPIAVLAFLCAAAFLIVAALPAPSALAAVPPSHYRDTVKLYCASDDWRLHWCPVDVGGGVELLKQKSQALCLYGKTWGYDDRGIWVDRGCRADFEAGEISAPPPLEGTFYCASNHFDFHVCRAYFRGGQIRLVNQRSGSPCIFNESWGFDPRGLWVDRGCRADFQFRRR